MICFALLAHKNEHALVQQIRNIRKYTDKNAIIVLYNGSKDPDFGKEVCRKENVLYCPYSRPLTWGKTGRFFYDVARWLADKKIKYDYLVYTEYDVMFIRNGFYTFIRNQLKGYDCMVKLIRHERDPKRARWKPGISMWKEWGQWKHFFRSDHFYGTFNPMQVYSYGIMQRMLARINRPMLESLFRKTNVFALGEMLYLTLAMKCGAKVKEYPGPLKEYLRVDPRISLKDAKEAKNKHIPFFLHPVKDDDVRKWIDEQ